MNNFHHSTTKYPNPKKNSSPYEPTTTSPRPMVTGHSHHPPPMRNNNQRGVSPRLTPKLNIFAYIIIIFLIIF